MNINDMDLDQASEAMLRISNAISFILEDPEVTGLLEDVGKSESTSMMQWIPKYLPRIAKAALQRHRESMYEIIAALICCDKKDAGKMKFGDVVALLKENWETLMGFFTSSSPSNPTNVTTPA